jgi:hypothetical protein
VVVQHILGAFSTLAPELAINSRQQVCHLGEQCGAAVIQLWNRRPSDAIKVSVSVIFVD